MFLTKKIFQDPLRVFVPYYMKEFLDSYIYVLTSKTTNILKVRGDFKTNASYLNFL